MPLSQSIAVIGLELEGCFWTEIEWFLLVSNLSYVFRFKNRLNSWSLVLVDWIVPSSICEVRIFLICEFLIGTNRSQIINIIELIFLQVSKRDSHSRVAKSPQSVCVGYPLFDEFVDITTNKENVTFRKHAQYREFSISRKILLLIKLSFVTCYSWSYN